MKYVNWDEVSPTTQTGASRFLKLTGKHRVRFITRPLKYEHKWEGDATAKPRYSAFVLDRDDDNQLKVMDFPVTVYSALSTWSQETKRKPHDSVAPDWVISRTGSGKMDTRYSIMPLDATTITQYDVAKLEQELLALRKGKV